MAKPVCTNLQKAFLADDINNHKEASRRVYSGLSSSSLPAFSIRFEINLLKSAAFLEVITGLPVRFSTASRAFAPLHQTARPAHSGKRTAPTPLARFFNAGRARGAVRSQYRQYSRQKILSTAARIPLYAAALM